MKWSLSELHRYSREPLHIDSTFDLKAPLTTRFPEAILDVTGVRAQGDVTYHNGDATMVVRVQTKLTVPSTRSLTEVELPLDFTFVENYTANPDHRALYDDDELVFVLENDQTMIDFDNALVENIYEQIPTKVLSAQEKAGQTFPAGKGWQVIDEQTHTEQKNQSVDPRLAKLKQLFPDQDDHN